MNDFTPDNFARKSTYREIAGPNRPLTGRGNGNALNWRYFLYFWRTDERTKEKETLQPAWEYFKKRAAFESGRDRLAKVRRRNSISIIPARFLYVSNTRPV